MKSAFLLILWNRMMKSNHLHQTGPETLSWIFPDFPSYEIRFTKTFEGIFWMIRMSNPRRSPLFREQVVCRGMIAYPEDFEGLFNRMQVIRSEVAA